MPRKQPRRAFVSPKALGEAFVQSLHLQPKPRRQMALGLGVGGPLASATRPMLERLRVLLQAHRVAQALRGELGPEHRLSLWPSADGHRVLLRIEGPEGLWWCEPGLRRHPSPHLSDLGGLALALDGCPVGFGPAIPVDAEAP